MDPECLPAELERARVQHSYQVAPLLFSSARKKKRGGGYLYKIMRERNSSLSGKNLSIWVNRKEKVLSMQMYSSVKTTAWVGLGSRPHLGGGGGHVYLHSSGQNMGGKG